MIPSFASLQIPLALSTRSNLLVHTLQRSCRVDVVQLTRPRPASRFAPRVGRIDGVDARLRVGGRRSTRRDLRLGLIAAGRDGDSPLVRLSRGQLVQDARLRPRPDERAQLADLGLEALEPFHLAAETNHFFDELRDVAFRAIQPVELFFDVPLGARTIVLQR